MSGAPNCLWCPTPYDRRDEQPWCNPYREAHEFDDDEVDEYTQDLCDTEGQV